MFEEIIAEVQSRPELWLSRHAHFKNRMITKKIWSDIAGRLGIEGIIYSKHFSLNLFYSKLLYSEKKFTNKFRIALACKEELLFRLLLTFRFSC
jgi:Alcohol dehydrogenase transcription factor Myb/SANT-like